MNINIVSTNFELTSEYRALVLDKLEDCFRALGDAKLDSVRVNVELDYTTPRRRKGRLFRAEANVALPGATVRVTEEDESIEKAVVKMKHTLTREIRTWRERIISNKRKGERQATNLYEEPADDTLE
jgi:ribosomal subunit interface protein